MKQSVISIVLQMVFAVLLQVNVNAAAPKLDPIKFTLTTVAESIALNEEFEFKITATYQNISPNIAYVFEGANSFKVKVVFPDGFKQTGGTYHDFIGADLSSSQPSVSYTVKGKFTKESEDGSFLLLRGNKNAHADSEFILVGKIAFFAFKTGLGNKEEYEARITAIIQSYIPYMTITQFNAGMADTSKVIYINEGKRSGIFIKDPSDTTTTADTALILGSSTMYGQARFKRKHDNIFYPEWWGAVGDGIANDLRPLSRAIFAASARRAELFLVSTYMIDNTVDVTCNVSGSGTIFTRGAGKLQILVDNIVVKNISLNGSIDGSAAGAPSGRAIYCQSRNNVIFDNITVSNIVERGFYIIGGSNIKVANCTIRNCRGLNGDGIYIRYSLNPLIIGNHVSEFTRIGIICEGDDTSGGGTTRIYTRDASIIGNTVINSIQSSQPNPYTNGGIWCENVAGAIVSNNTVSGLHARGIVVTPNIGDFESFQYIISGNKITSVVDEPGYTGTGIAMSSAENQVMTVSNNIITDCRRGMEVGYPKVCNIIGNTFDRKEQLETWFVDNIFLLPSLSAHTWQSVFKISNCINNINYTTRLPLRISDVFGQQGDISISDCVGNFAFVLGNRAMTGNIKVSNTLLDYSSLSALYFFANVSGSGSGKATFTDCDMIVPNVAQIGACGNELTIDNCRISSSSPTRIFYGDSGFSKTKVTNSTFRNVRFHDIRRAGTEFVLENSDFDGYDLSQGLFENTVIQVSKVEVFGCRFSKTNTVTPIQFASGVADFSAGHNLFYSIALSDGNLSAARQSISLQRGTTAQRPSTSQVGYLYFDTTLNKEIYWNGSEWVLLTTPPSFISDPSNTALTKATLNANYGTLKAGSTITCNSIPTGAYEYRKLSDSNTSDWVQTQWSTGNKALAL
ncbi:right-handed parallel beta-helix repeat-containing protein [Dyadobacter sp. CY261]|uniref:right-handed parallel beta-helix repeat-containing protein n=1 Tax=Dyadobacter sp. CY261 TaxID=2907203 RepID=UPI001F4914FC|nr:right-handed parallel beta-helix repeat-containing protein [Dyadobacter sp. CY261]MCF0073995.1 right-handed parallel beta-helix repeat-containing protein [Dyadobacter sp. CY261]